MITYDRVISNKPPGTIYTVYIVTTIGDQIYAIDSQKFESVSLPCLVTMSKHDEIIYAKKRMMPVAKMCSFNILYRNNDLKMSHKFHSYETECLKNLFKLHPEIAMQI